MLSAWGFVRLGPGPRARGDGELERSRGNLKVERRNLSGCTHDGKWMKPFRNQSPRRLSHISSLFLSLIAPNKLIESEIQEAADADAKE